MVNDSFWDRLATRVRPTEALKTIDNPRIIVRAATGGLLVGVVQILVTAGVFALFDEVSVAWAVVVLAGAYLLAWVWFAATGSVFTAGAIGLVSGTLVNIYVHVELGGYANSGAIFLFGIYFVTTAALFLGKRVAVIVGTVHTIVGVVFAFMEESLRASRSAPDPTLTTILFVAVLVGSINLVAPLLVYFMGRLSYERERAESLLLNVLPPAVASELKETGHTIARRHESVSVLFADAVGFTPMASTMEPELVVAQIDEIFTYFDSLTEIHSVEKIRTIGDSYMAAAGIPTPNNDHAAALAAMALDMLAYARTSPLTFRIGINSGPVVAGVIGSHKFQYDIWGDTVNTASRMESHGEPGRIQISDSTRDLIKERFVTTQRGPVDVKGKGLLTTWWLEDETPEALLRPQTNST